MKNVTEDQFPRAAAEGITFVVLYRPGRGFLDQSVMILRTDFPLNHSVIQSLFPPWNLQACVLPRVLGETLMLLKSWEAHFSSHTQPFSLSTNMKGEIPKYPSLNLHSHILRLCCLWKSVAAISINIKKIKKYLHNFIKHL